MTFSSAEEFALCSAVNDDFAVAYILMIHSFRRENPALRPRLYVIAESGEQFLSAAAREMMLRWCGEIEFVDVDPLSYETVHMHARTTFKTPDRLMPAFYILEAFNHPAERKVLCLDSDMLIFGSLEEVFLAEGSFVAVRARDASTGRPRAFVNTGVMLVDRERMNGLMTTDYVLDAIRDLTPRRGTGLADQAIINLFMPNRRITYLPSIFNYTKRSLLISYLRRHPENEYLLKAQCEIGTADEMVACVEEDDIRILHFVGEKPWQIKQRSDERSFAAIDEIWWRELKALDDGELSGFVYGRMQSVLAAGVQ